MMKNNITNNSPILTIQCIAQGKNKNIKTKKKVFFRGDSSGMLPQEENLG
jgi:hypothetical protein